MTILLELHQFWDFLQSDIAWNNPYTTNIRGIRLQLCKLQKSNKEAKTIRGFAGLLEEKKDVKGVLQYQGLSYVLQLIRFKVINCHHNDLLAEHFDINKIRELVGQKYYWPSLKKDVEAYVQGCDVCLASKAVRYKPYGDLQSSSIPIHR